MVRARDSVEPDLKSATDARANNQHLIYTGCSLAYLFYSSAGPKTSTSHAWVVWTKSLPPSLSVSFAYTRNRVPTGCACPQRLRKTNPQASRNLLARDRSDVNVPV